MSSRCAFSVLVVISVFIWVVNWFAFGGGATSLFRGLELTLVQHGALVFVTINTLTLFIGGHLYHFDSFRDRSQVVALLVDQIVLLGSQNRARSRNTDPSNEVSCREPEMLHSIDADQGARAAEPCLAMDRNCASLSF